MFTIIMLILSRYIDGETTNMSDFDKIDLWAKLVVPLLIDTVVVLIVILEINS